MVKSCDDGFGSVAPFLRKCYEMVDDDSTDSLISWSQTNDSFIIWDSSDFSLRLLPQYFKHSNFSSFIRQLNIYVGIFSFSFFLSLFFDRFSLWLFCFFLYLLCFDASDSVCINPTIKLLCVILCICYRICVFCLWDLVKMGFCWLFWWILWCGLNGFLVFYVKFFALLVSMRIYIVDSEGRAPFIL